MLPYMLSTRRTGVSLTQVGGGAMCCNYCEDSSLRETIRCSDKVFPANTHTHTHMHMHTHAHIHTHLKFPLGVEALQSSNGALSVDGGRHPVLVLGKEGAQAQGRLHQVGYQHLKTGQTAETTPPISHQLSNSTNNQLT